MFRRAWKPIAAVAIAGPPIYWLYHRSATSAALETFDVTIRETGPDGKSRRVVRSFPMLPKDSIDARIREHATVDNWQPQSSGHGRMWKVSTAYLASNDPIEDRNAHAAIPPSPLLPSERLFVAVMDGHAGFHTSQFLSHALIPAVVAELVETSKAPSPTSVFQRVLSLFWSRQDPQNSSVELSPEQTSCAIQSAFTKLDYEIITAPLKLFAAKYNNDLLKKGKIPDMSDDKLALAAMQPALSGARGCV